MNPSMRERRSGIGRLVWWTVWVLLIVYVINHPGQAADQARALLAGIQDASEAIATFLAQAGGR